MKRFALNRRTLLTASFWLGLLAMPMLAWAGILQQHSVLDAPPNQQQPAPKDNISVPAQFLISLSGSTEAGAFQELPAILELTPPQAGDPNPLLIALYMAAQSEDVLVNGSLFWQSFTAGHPQQGEHFSQVTVTSNQVQMQLNPSENPIRSDVMWFTQVTGTLADMMMNEGVSLRSGATGTAGTMLIRLEGDRVLGEIQLSGITDFGVASTYEAQFSGQRQ